MKDSISSELSNFNTLDTQNLVSESSLFSVLSLVTNSLDSMEYLSTSDSTLLISIANLCPLEGGRAVYTARGMMDFENYNENDNCDTIYIRSQNEKEKLLTNTGKLIVKPNPNIGRFEIQFPAISSYDVEIYSLSGKRIGQKIIYGSNSEISIMEKGIFIIVATDIRAGSRLISKVVVLDN